MAFFQHVRVCLNCAVCARKFPWFHLKFISSLLGLYCTHAVTYPDFPANERKPSFHQANKSTFDIPFLFQVVQNTWTCDHPIFACTHPHDALQNMQKNRKKFHQQKQCRNAQAFLLSEATSIHNIKYYNNNWHAVNYTNTNSSKRIIFTNTLSS